MDREEERHLNRERAACDAAEADRRAERTDDTRVRLPLEQMRRWVERAGNRVRFGNVVGAFAGVPYEYEFPNSSLADGFERLVRGVDASGVPNAVPRAWHRYARGESRRA